MKPSPGLKRARQRAKERIAAGLGDREAVRRYLDLAARCEAGSPVAADFRERAAECERLARSKLQSTQ